MKKHNQPEHTPEHTEGHETPPDPQGSEAGGAAGKGGQTTEAGDPAGLRAERDRLLEQLQRTLADMQNLRRQTRRQIEESRGVTLAQLLGEFLPVLDNLERATAAGGDPKAVAQGLEMVLALFRGLLERNGVEKIPAKGEPFDPRLHEAVRAEPRSDLPPGTVIEEVVSGYRLPDRVLRAAKVAVSGEPATPGAGNADSGSPRNPTEPSEE